MSPNNNNNNNKKKKKENSGTQFCETSDPGEEQLP